MKLQVRTLMLFYYISVGIFLLGLALQIVDILNPMFGDFVGWIFMLCGLGGVLLVLFVGNRIVEKK